MSATPIPRTLHMSLLGLRDMSVIETPPKDRLAINTVVAHFGPDLIKAAIEQELARQGQVSSFTTGSTPSLCGPLLYRSWLRRRALEWDTGNGRSGARKSAAWLHAA